MSETSPLLIFCTCRSQTEAERLAHHLIAARLAACVNILPGLTSIYRWREQVETAAEHLLLIKSDDAAYPALEAAIKSLHDYEVPEIVAIDIARGLPAYLNWMRSCLS